MFKRKIKKELEKLGLIKVRYKTIDIVLMIVFPIFASIITLLFKTNFFTSTLLYFGLPALYLSFRLAKAISKSLICAVICSIFLTLVIDYLAYLDQAAPNFYS